MTGLLPSCKHFKVLHVFLQVTESKKQAEIMTESQQIEDSNSSEFVGTFGWLSIRPACAVAGFLG